MFPEQDNLASRCTIENSESPSRHDDQTTIRQDSKESADGVKTPISEVKAMGFGNQNHRAEDERLPQAALIGVTGVRRTEQRSEDEADDTAPKNVDAQEPVTSGPSLNEIPGTMQDVQSRPPR